MPADQVLFFNLQAIREMSWEPRLITARFYAQNTKYIYRANKKGNQNTHMHKNYSFARWRNVVSEGPQIKNL